MYKCLRLHIIMSVLFTVMCSITASSQVIYKDVSTTLAAGQFVSIDIDTDGDNEIQVFNNVSQVNIYSPNIAPVGATNIQMLTHFFATSTIDQLTAGTTIGVANAASFRNGVTNGCIGSCLSPNPAVWPSSVSNVYIAFRFTDVGTGFLHYGWMKVDVVISGSIISSITIVGIAYEATPNADIITGLVPVSSISVQGQGGTTTIATLGETLQMEETVLPASANNNNVSWTVDNPSVGTIDASGELTAVANGTVRVFATAQDGSGVSGFTDIDVNSILSINEFVAEGVHVSIFPNPFKNELSISINTTTYSNNVELMLVDFTGKILYTDSKNLILGENTFQLGKLNISKGMYNLIIKSPNKVFAKKLVKY